jgi:hypothetical protein
MRVIPLFALATLAASPSVGVASSHREAPMIAEDPVADPTDLYVFRSPTEDVDGKDTLTIVANWWPLEEPGGGPNFPRFGQDMIYRILIDNTGDAKADIIYQFQFETVYHAGKESFLYNKGPVKSPTDENLLVRQTCKITRFDGKKKSVQDGVAVAPVFVGQASFGNEAAYEAVARQAVTPLTVKGGGKVFLGPRDDPFFVDLGSVFDLLQIRGGAPGGAGKGGGVDFLAGYNVHSIALQIPIAALTADGTAKPAHGKASILGVWTGAWRAKVTTLQPGQRPKVKGYQQVSRLAIPLVNEVLVPVGVKDFFNSTEPPDDAKNAAGFLQDPELARLFKQLYNLKVPGPGRTDIIALISFNLGVAPLDVPGLQPADLMRIDVSVPPSSIKPKSRLGLLAGDAAGFPNGRRLADDVVDIAERVVAGVLCTKGKTCDVEANTTPLGDAVDQNDKPFQTRFPYLAAPHSGSTGGPIHAKATGHASVRRGGRANPFRPGTLATAGLTLAAAVAFIVLRRRARV